MKKMVTIFDVTEIASHVASQNGFKSIFKIDPMNPVSSELKPDLIYLKTPKFIESSKEEYGQLIKRIFSIIDQKKPKWIVWELQSGIIYDQNGSVFRSIISEIGELGYGISWRVFNSKYFNSPIDSEKLFLVASFGEWESSREVLFESGSSLGSFEVKGKKRPVKKPSSIQENSGVTQLTKEILGDALNFPKSIVRKSNYQDIKDSCNSEVLRFIFSRINKIKS